LEKNVISLDKTRSWVRQTIADLHSNQAAMVEGVDFYDYLNHGFVALLTLDPAKFDASFPETLQVSTCLCP
jgi:hypothetical protein